MHALRSLAFEFESTTSVHAPLNTSSKIYIITFSAAWEGGVREDERRNAGEDKRGVGEGRVMGEI